MFLVTAEPSASIAVNAPEAACDPSIGTNTRSLLLVGGGSQFALGHQQDRAWCGARNLVRHAPHQPAFEWPIAQGAESDNGWRLVLDRSHDAAHRVSYGSRAFCPDAATGK